MAITALKEWAVAVKALREGRQVLLVRKGGISEETRHFRISAERFLLFPTREHQRADLLQPAFQDDLAAVLAAPSDPSVVRFDTWGEMTDLWEITEPAQVEALAPFYCFSTGYAEERLRWKPRHPLLVMAVRAYRLDTPLTLPMRKEFGGCKSWLTLDDDLAVGGLTAALDDATYAEQIAAVRAALERATPAAV
ncbi:MAG: DUF1802 family protein [Chloroflexi bacterium]|nr:DUF1802 family protein [Chloroflexota bacterium]